MKNFAETLTTALIARNEVAPSKDTQLAINNAKRFATALDGLFTKKAFHAIADKLITRCAIAQKNAENSNDFIAVKVLVKVVSASVAIAQKNKDMLDPYSRNIIENMIALQTINNKDALVTLSKSISYTETEQSKNLQARYNCSAGTASTQASSTRMMLQALDVCEIVKGKRGDEMTFKDNERAKQVIAMFGAKVEAEEEANEEETAAE